MPRVLSLYYVTYVVFLSNRQLLKNKRHSLLLLPIFGFPQKNEKIQKEIYIKKYSKEIQKIIGARKGCWNAEKWLKIE